MDQAWEGLKRNAAQLGTDAASIEAARKSGQYTPQELAKELQTTKLTRAFDEATSSPELQQYLQEVGFTSDDPITPQKLMEVLSAGAGGLSAQGSIDKIRDNIADFVEQAKLQAINGGKTRAIDTALAQNAALLATYSAIALTMPNFQWTYVGAFVANDVRAQLIGIHETRPGSILPETRDYLIDTIIGGQIDVVTDIGSLALAYREHGKDILNARSVYNDDAARLGFHYQIQADAALAEGDLGGLIHGRDAAIQFGIREQTKLQEMWNKPILNFWTKAGQVANLFPGPDPVDPTIHTPIGNIAAPEGAFDVTNLDHRIEIAKNAFQYMYSNFFFGPTGNQDSVINALTFQMNPAWLSQPTERNGGI